MMVIIIIAILSILSFFSTIISIIITISTDITTMFSIITVMLLCYYIYPGGTAKKNGRDKNFLEPQSISGQTMWNNRECRPVMLCSNISMPIRVGTGDSSSGGSNSSNSGIGSSSSITSSTSGSSGTNRDINGSRNNEVKNSSIKNIEEIKKKNNEIKLLCYTAPYARCSENHTYIQIRNLHIHSKHTINYMSQTCECNKL